MASNTLPSSFRSLPLWQRTALQKSLPRRHQFIRLLSTQKPPNFGFAFDIDGVLCRSNSALPNAGHALRTLRQNNIPFILLTNGGGTSEQARVKQLSSILEVPISLDQFVQSHTPFSEFTHLSDKTALVMGGPHDGHSCREVALGYGFGEVVTPMDIYAAHPAIWPFGMALNKLDKTKIKPLPKPLAIEAHDRLSPETHLKIDAIFVFNDPRDWSTDTTVLLDTLLSHQGYIGTLSPNNGNVQLPNRGYLQDGQPPVYFSNPDVWWAAKWHNSRLGQGAFRAAFEGVFKAATDGAELLHAEQWGKPHQLTYEFAEKRLVTQREDVLESHTAAVKGLEKVYMVGGKSNMNLAARGMTHAHTDNPESDIRGANNFRSGVGTDWRSLLVRTGVYSGGEPTAKPKAIVDNVWEAVRHAFKENNFTPRT